jgi:TPR repeat protein
LEVLQEEAEKAHDVASGFLKKMRETDKEMSEDDHRAFQWLRKTTRPGDVIAQYQLGKMYAQGTLCEKDKCQARECFELAIREGTTIDEFLKKAKNDPTFTSNFLLRKKRDESEGKEGR